MRRALWGSILGLWLASVVGAQPVPRPEAVLGFRPGADFQLADYATLLRYYRALDAASERVEMLEIGRSAMGRPMMLLLISDAENLRQRERYRRISEQLAKARLSEEEARRLAREGRAIVWIDNGLHATEVAPAQHAPELAYYLATDESPETQRIRRETILLLMPCMNPDGLDTVVTWYRRHLGTPFETSPLPWLYHKYVGHDNNRDWYMQTQPETQAVSRVLYREWFPQIVLNHHQVAPFPARIFVPPFADPSNPNIHPLIMRGITLVGNAMATRLEQKGKAGVVSRRVFSTWWNGGMRTVPYFHNMIGLLTETALYRYATPRYYAPDELPDTFAGGLPTRVPTTDYPMPWLGGWWRLRDAVEYIFETSMATLDVASRYREELLWNLYQMGREAIERGRMGSPKAWVIPPDQWDPSAAVALVNVLWRGGLEVWRADAPFEADGRRYPAGAYIVPAAQAFQAYARDLLEPQVYTDIRRPGQPPEPPYDIAGWTLPSTMGVRVERIEGHWEPPKISVIENEIKPPASIQGDGRYVAFSPRSNDSFRWLNRALEAGLRVYRSAEAVSALGSAYGPGTVFVDLQGSAGERFLRQITAEGAQGVRTNALPGGARALRRVRVGIYEPWRPSMDAGWTRWLLEQYGFAYRVLRDQDIRNGNLRAQLDAIILPSEGVAHLVRGFEPGTMPEEYTGGLGDAGLAALRAFVREGGTLIALDEAAQTVMRYFDVPVASGLEGLRREEFYCPGSVLRLYLDVRHPIAWGMPPETAAYFINSQAFVWRARTGERQPGEANLEPGQSRDGATVVGVYPRIPLLQSGWLLGEQHLQGKAAVVEVKQGQGRYVLLGFGVQFRGQPHATFKLLFNSLLYAIS
ncbi:MAG: M14 family metallopeptidase [Bacteroidetes bacterium]|nr:M14 family metallopeptidase [Bacteroidota bacterium]